MGSVSDPNLWSVIFCGPESDLDYIRSDPVSDFSTVWSSRHGVGQEIPDSKYAYIDRGVSETDDVNVGIKVETIAACAFDAKELIDRNPGRERFCYRSCHRLKIKIEIFYPK